jgi:long-chain acyl-CoA synthetase
VLNERESADLSSLRILNNGGEPCPPALVKGFEDHTGLHLLGSYATSEARPITLVRPGDTTAPVGTVGKLVPGAEIRLVAPDGLEVPVGEVGHALLRCPGLMTEYYREPSLTAERLTPDGWLKTGDLLKVDAEGYYFVVGRQTDMIIRSGANVAPAEVESALVTHPSIAVAAVVGVPDVRSGEAIRAVIVAEPGTSPTEDELRQALSGQLAAYKVPQEFIFVAELPRTDRGKIDRHALQLLERS